MTELEMSGVLIRRNSTLIVAAEWRQYIVELQLRVTMCLV